MAENSESDFTVEGSIRHRHTTGTIPRGEDIDFLLSLVDELRAGKSVPDFTEGWNSALHVIYTIAPSTYMRRKARILRGPGSKEFQQALARFHDPFDEGRGSGY